MTTTVLLVAALLPVTVNGARAHGACPTDLAAGNRVCPAPDDSGHPYFVSITSYAASNGIAVLFTKAGMEHAVTCHGAEELATMIARLYALLPGEERGEESIDWAIPPMTGEITGHARMYSTLSSDLVRNRTNPVNIVFPEYRGAFADGIAGMTARAQQILYASLCSSPADPPR